MAEGSATCSDMRVGKEDTIVYASYPNLLHTIEYRQIVRVKPLLYLTLVTSVKGSCFTE
jgi:hypothetical protein